MSKYAGLCVGGPRDGNQEVWPSPIFYCVDNTISVNEGPDTYLVKHAYYFEQIFGIGFWRHESLEQIEMIETLAVIYKGIKK